MKLFLLESKKILKSLPIWIVSIIICVSIVSQVSNSYKIQPPTEEEVTYKHTEDMEVVYPALTADLVQSITNNSFATYPNGFYRNVTLNEKEIKLLTQILIDMTGTDDIDKIPEALSFIPSKEEIEKNLTKIDAVLGGGSSYALNRYIFEFGRVQTTYEERVEEYHLMQVNGLDVAFTRLFCDYASIFTMLLLIFIPLSLWLQDRRKQISDTLFTKPISSTRLFFVRFFALVFWFTLLLVLLFSYYEFRMLKIYPLEYLQPLNAYRLLLLWLLPNITLGISLGSLLTILINNIFVGILGPLLSFAYLMLYSPNIQEDYTYGPLLRHNSIGLEVYFRDHFQLLLNNRLLWLSISMIICMLSIFILDRRRRGYLWHK